MWFLLNLSGPGRTSKIVSLTAIGWKLGNGCNTTPLVVQLIGSNINFLVAAANTVQELGAEHLNINLGCPYGRMTTNTAGGALLKSPADLPLMLKSLRKAISRQLFGKSSVRL